MNNLEFIKNIFKIINIEINDLNDLPGKEINRDLLLTKNVKNKYLELIIEAKKLYKSSKLTSLHKNCNSKQKNHSINFLRQILKCNNFKLVPRIVSLGYAKNGKKIIQRSYIINYINTDKNIECNINYVNKDSNHYNEISELLDDIILKL